MTATSEEIESILQESRVFPPPTEFSANAHISGMEQYRQLAAEAEADLEGFWARQAESLHWFKKWDQVLDWQPPFAKWFQGGTTNVAYNCLDRHLDGPRKNKAALIWEGEPGEERILTYGTLHREVCKFANVLKGLGVQKGDRVGIYMPLVPEAVIAMLACARIGATHSVVFGGFSAEAVRERMNDAEAKVVVTANTGYRRGAEVPLKQNVDDAVKDCPSVQHVVVFQRNASETVMQDGRDRWWHELMADASADCPAEELDAEHPLYILYTSGSTGKPKGVQHSTAGYLLGTALTSRWVFDLKDEDIFWCTADIGWVTGHSYVVYGPLASGATVLMYEGAPNYPQPDRFWELIEKYRVTILYTAPTAIRSFMRWGEQWPNAHDLSSLRLLGSVGEPINPEAWIWYQRVIGGGRCPVVDTWWQTETGMIMISPLPGATPTKPGSATLPLPGVFVEIVDGEGNPVPANQGGLLVLTRPWPSMLRTLYHDDARYAQYYWEKFGSKHFYFAGDGARRDADGYLWLMGRVDDVINVAGHRLGTMEVESALVAHPAVAEAAVVGKPDEIRGEAISAFVTVEQGREAGDALRDELKAWVVKEIGALARPDEIRFTDALPKTRSGKIMRRLLRDIAAGRESGGDTTTLEDYTVLAKLREEEE